MLQAGGLGRLEKSWVSTPVTIDAQIYQQLTTLVARSRDQAENNDHAAKFLQMVETNVVGPSGFTLKSQVKDPSGKLDLAAQGAIESTWAEFSKIGNFDVTGTLSRSDGEKLSIKQAATDGEIFIIRHVNADLSHGIAIELVDGCMIDPQHFAKTNEGNYIRHGIEFTPYGKPVAYHFSEYDEQQTGVINYTTQKRRILAENVAHIFLPEKVGQKRGLPWMRTALWRMKMLQGYEDATITLKRTESALTGFISDPDGNNVEDAPLELAEPGQFLDIGNRVFTRPQLSNGGGDYEAFQKAALRSIGSGLKVNYNTMGNDLEGVNFSSIRQGALDEREMWKGLQEWFIGQFEHKIFQWWLPVALASQKIKLESGKPLPFAKLDKYRPVLFRGRRWAWIDPLSEMKANELAISLGVKSRTEVTEDLGRDLEDVLTEISRENETMQSMGLDPRLPDEKLAAASKPTQQDAKKTAA